MSKILQTLQRLEESRVRAAAPAAAPPRSDPLASIRPEPPPAETRLLPIASGKGGVGKTNFAVALSLALAEALRGGGGRVVLLDADFGMPNADLVLGCSVVRTLDDVAAKRVASLEEALAPTAHPNLMFLGGSDRPSAALTHLDVRTRRRFRRHVDSLSAAHLVIDLGAGADDAVSDFVSMTNAAIIVTTPEPTARRDALLLLRQAVGKRIRQETRDVEALADRVGRLCGGDPAFGVPDLLLSLREDGLRAEERLVREILARFRPRLVVNRAEDAHEGAETFRSIDDRARQDLGIRPVHLGTIPDDRSVVEAVKVGRPFLYHAPDSPAARALLEIARRIEGDESFSFERNIFSFAAYVRRLLARRGG